MGNKTRTNIEWIECVFSCCDCVIKVVFIGMGSPSIVLSITTYRYYFNLMLVSDPVNY